MTTLSEQRSTLARGLSGLLADTYTLFNSTQNCHWNVTGPQFKSLHDLFEEQYTELADAIDTIAERVRALGFCTPGTIDEITSMTRVRQRSGPADAGTMLDWLVGGHEVVIHRLKELQQLAEKQVDEATMDLLVERQRVHEKMIWFLKSQSDSHSSKTLVTATTEALVS